MDQALPRRVFQPGTNIPHGATWGMLLQHPSPALPFPASILAPLLGSHPKAEPLSMENLALGWFPHCLPALPIHVRCSVHPHAGVRFHPPVVRSIPGSSHPRHPIPHLPSLFYAVQSFGRGWCRCLQLSSCPALDPAVPRLLEGLYGQDEEEALVKHPWMGHPIGFEGPFTWTHPLGTSICRMKRPLMETAQAEQ